MKKLNFYIAIFLSFTFNALLAQNDVNNIIKAGNDAYTQGDFVNAYNFYNKALQKNSNNYTAKFNLGNALERQHKNAEAEKYYNQVASSANDADLKSKAFYNKAIAALQQQKLDEAIEAFKQSLMLNPSDDDTRENLQKAMNELKKNQKNSSEKQKPKQQNQQKNKKQEKPNQQMINQKFNELRDKEKQLQKMLQKKNNTAQPEKDW